MVTLFKTTQESRAHQWQGRDFPGGSADKESACNAGNLGLISGLGKIPWRMVWQATPVSLPGESHGQRSLVGYSPWGRKESDMTGRLSPAQWWGRDSIPGKQDIGGETSILMTETLNPNHCWLLPEKLGRHPCLLTWAGITMAIQSRQKPNYGIDIKFLEHMSPDFSLLKNAFFLSVFMRPCSSNFSPSHLITASQALLWAFLPPSGVLSMAFSLSTLYLNYFHYSHSLENFSETPKSIAQCWKSLHINFWYLRILELFMTSPWKWAHFLI